MASDHRGAALKEGLRKALEREGWEIEDYGTHGSESVDYPEFAAQALSAGLGKTPSRTKTTRTGSAGWAIAD